MDMKEKKLTVIGTVDPVSVVIKLRKYWQTDIVTVGPAKEPDTKKEDQPKMEPASAAAKQDGTPKDHQEPKKEKQELKLPAEEPKKEEAGKEKKEEVAEKKEETAAKDEEEPKKQGPLLPPDPVLEMVRAHRAYNPQMNTYYYAQSMEENPNGCVIS